LWDEKANLLLSGTNTIDHRSVRFGDSAESGFSFGTMVWGSTTENLYLLAS